MPIIANALVYAALLSSGKTKQALILIENPEAHLHPAGQTKMGEFLTSPAVHVNSADDFNRYTSQKEIIMKELVSKHYDEKYFDWQSSIGEFGGWANQTKFVQYIEDNSDVLDFGCGGGFLLNGLRCRKKVGVEINPTAAETARSKGIEVFDSVEKVSDDYVDTIISNNALEHILLPLEELKMLHRKLRKGGKIIFVVPCESISYRYKPKDVNHHLYSWSPMCIGNLFTEAGFTVIESKPYIHKWPPKYRLIAKLGGARLFEMAARIYGRIERSWFQVRVIAEK